MTSTSPCRLPAFWILLLALGFAIVARAADPGPGNAAEADDVRPNVVFILTDNQGAWTLGCYGNPDIHTPHIDRLAEQGTLLTRCFANNAVCSPTRASLLTGLMPCQHGVHCYLGAGRLQIGRDARNTVEEFDTLPSLLANAGYTCGLSGKWHLGDNLHPQEGFTFWYTKPHGHTAGFYDQKVITDGKIYTEPEYLTEFWTDRAVEFIEQNQRGPFFLMLAYNGPYGLGTSVTRPIRNRHRDRYANADLPSFPRTEPHPWNHNYGNRIGDIQCIRRYAAEVSGIDDGVGRVMETLRRLGLDQNTLVVFTADQGMSGGHSGFWGMGDHTRPLTAFDWTIHVPMIIRHPGRVVAGQRYDGLVSNIDLLPTLVDYLGLSWSDRDQPTSPGRGFAPVLIGQEHPNPRDAVFYEFENVRAIRTDRWKYIERFRQEPNELYDLRADPEELNNLIDDAQLADVRERLARRLHEWFNRIADPRWDLWHGGKSKSMLIQRKLFSGS